MEQKQKNKPLHKDLSFWIVVLTLVAAADIAQIQFGIPWFRQRLRAAHPAPRTDFEAAQEIVHRTPPPELMTKTNSHE